MELINILSLHKLNRAFKFLFLKRLLRRRPVIICALIVMFVSLTSCGKAFGELEGHHLRGCVINQVPYTFPEKNRRAKFGGVAIAYLDKLKNRLDFSFELKEWNGTWHSLIDHMSECDWKEERSFPIEYSSHCQCDIAVGPFSITNERMKKVSFLWPFESEYNRFVTMKSNQQHDSNRIWFFFEAFTPAVWAFIAFLLIIHTIGTCLYAPFRLFEQNGGASLAPPRGSAYGTDSEQNREIVSELPRELEGRTDRGQNGTTTQELSGGSQRATEMMALNYSYAHFAGMSLQSRPEPKYLSANRTSWLLLGLMAGFLLRTMYEASLAALLSEDKRISGLQSFEDLMNCKVSPEKIAMVHDSFEQKYWNDRLNTTATKEKCGWKTAGFTVQDLEEGFKCLESGEAEFFFDLEGSILYRAYKNCRTFAPVGEPFLSTSVSFFVPKPTTARQEFLLYSLSEETRYLREGDMYSSSKTIALRRKCSRAPDSAITGTELYGFLSLYVLCFVVIVVCRGLILFACLLKSIYSESSAQNISPSVNLLEN